MSLADGRGAIDIGAELLDVASNQLHTRLEDVATALERIVATELLGHVHASEVGISKSTSE